MNFEENKLSLYWIITLNLRDNTGYIIIALGKLVTEKPVDFVDFDSFVKFNKNRQNDDNVVKAYKS